MRAYYDAQAATYEDFYFGRGQAVPELAAKYAVDREAVSALLTTFGTGDVLDLACGTAFWLSVYGRNCRTVTLVDQSASSLARGKERVDAMGLGSAASFVHGDLFEVPLGVEAFDAAFLGFLASHLTESQMVGLFARLRRCVRPGAELALVDSAWSEARRPYRVRDGFAQRAVSDGRVFAIRKRYFELPELTDLLARHGFRAERSYAGDVFVGVRARRVV
jgi:ubiquinone/menaquinone biosynthesis C-methylase UbiE